MFRPVAEKMYVTIFLSLRLRTPFHENFCKKTFILLYLSTVDMSSRFCYSKQFRISHVVHVIFSLHFMNSMNEIHIWNSYLAFNLQSDKRGNMIYIRILHRRSPTPITFVFPRYAQPIHLLKCIFIFRSFHFSLSLSLLFWLLSSVIFRLTDLLVFLNFRMNCCSKQCSI